MSWRVTVSCTRAQAEAVPEPGDIFLDGPPPVIVADEPDESKPDQWLLHAYFERPPTPADLDRLGTLGNGRPVSEELGRHLRIRFPARELQPAREHLA